MANEQEIIDKAIEAVEKHMQLWSIMQRCEKIITHADYRFVPNEIHDEYKLATHNFDLGIIPRMHEMMTLMDSLITIIENRSKEGLQSDRR